MSNTSAPCGWFQLSLKTILLVMAGIGIYLAARYPHQPAAAPTRLLPNALKVGDRLSCYPSSSHGGWRLEIKKSGSYEVLAIGDDFVQVQSGTRQRFIPLASITSIDNLNVQSAAAASTANVAAASGASPAAGESPYSHFAARLIDRYDKDQDGALSTEESARTPAASVLKQADGNVDGKVTAEELGAHVQSRSSRSYRGR